MNLLTIAVCMYRLYQNDTLSTDICT